MIFERLKQQLGALSGLLERLSDAQYMLQIPHLGHASIGAHTRHIIELLQCAVLGYQSGKVDYDNRVRNLDLQHNKDIAQIALHQLASQIEASDKTLKLVVASQGDAPEPPVETTYLREMVYNTEHAIHHLALIKVALIDMKLDLVDAHFGMAYSTIKYKATLEPAS
jgi:hypothetical protein